MATRWDKAQMSEKQFWEESFADEPAFQKMCLSFYPVYKEFLDSNNLKEFGAVLDLGSGPYSCLVDINAISKYALDPLMDYFLTKVSNEFYLEHNIVPIIGSGEQLTFGDGFFDLICCINTLDHAEEPETILEEANRCLKPSGYLLLSINHYAWPIVIYRNLLEMIGLGDICHPNTYHLSGIKELLEEYKYKIIAQKIGDINLSKQKISEVGGTTSISYGQRISRALKSKGLWYVIKQAIVAPGHLVFNKLFKTYPDSIFLCQKVEQ